ALFTRDRTPLPRGRRSRSTNLQDRCVAALRVDDGSHAGALAAARAAASTSSTTASGWETIATWLEGTSTVSAPIRSANIRSASGAIASSLAATRYHEWSDFHAGVPMTSSKTLIAT